MTFRSHKDWITLRSILSLWGKLQDSPYIQPPTSFPPMGMDGREGFEQAHAEWHYSSPQMRAHSEHWLCGPQRICTAESHLIGPGPFISHKDSQAGESVLYSPGPLLCRFDLSCYLAQLWDLCLLCSVFQLFSCLSRTPCLGSEAEQFVQRSASSQLCFSSSNHRDIRRDMEHPWVIHTEAVNQSCVLALQKKGCSREQDLKYLNLF